MPGEVDLGIEGLSDYQRIGSGGFATVYSASEAGAGRRVAVKVLDAVDEAGRRRFDRERLTMGMTTEHPNIVTMFRSGYTPNGDRPYLVLEHLDRGSLRERLDTTGPVPRDEAIEIVATVAGALEFAHSAGIVHKDVKPANILVSGRGIVKLSDFGIAAIKEATHGTQLAVSFLYAPPEAFTAEVDPVSGQTADPRDERSDLYSLAATLHAMVSGGPPFRASNQVALMRQILEEPAPPTGHPDLDRFLARAMAKDPADRFPTAADFVAALRHLRTAEGTTPAPAALPAAAPTDATTPADPLERPTQPAGPISPAEQISPAPQAPPIRPGRRRGRGRWTVAAALAVAVLAGLLVYRGLRGLDDDAGSDVAGPSSDTPSSTTGPPPSLPAAPVVYTGHRDLADDPDADGVVALAGLADGTIASGSGDTTVQIWDPDDPTLTMATFTGHRAAVAAVIALRSGLVASGDGDGLVEIWDPDGTGTVLGSHDGHSSPDGESEILALTELADGRVASAGADGTVQVWSPDDPARTERTFTGHRDRAGDPDADGVFALVQLGDGRVASGGADGTVQVWWPDDPASPPAIYEGHGRRVQALAVLDDGRVVSGGADGTVHVWDPDDPTATQGIYAEHQDRVLALLALPDDLVASAGADGTVRIWSADDLADVAAPYTRHRDLADDADEDGVGTLLALPDGRIASGSADGTVQIWSWEVTR